MGVGRRLGITAWLPRDYIIVKTIADTVAWKDWHWFIIAKDDYDLWLDPGVTDPAKVADLMKPFDSCLMRVYPVSPTVGNVKNDGPECAEEIKNPEEEAPQHSLFS